MLSLSATLLLHLTLATTLAASPPHESDTLRHRPVTRIAFGSCANQSAPQPIWDAILEFDPDVFVWMGDNVYGDNKRGFRVFGKERTVGPWKNAPRFVPASEEEMRGKYEQARGVPGYAALRRRAQVIGTWDDHDYGLNDAGKEFSGKNVSQRLMLDFLEEPKDSTRRRQAGVYCSYLFGPKGRDVKVILLDTRYHRDPLFSDGTILGTSQWSWLEKELHSPPSKITIIVSSIQVISNISAVTKPLFHLESWGLFPAEKDKLFKLIAKSKRDGVIFLSGDVHFGEITRYDCACDYPLYDITSSGLTQAVEKAVPPPLALLVSILAWLTPTTMRVYGPKCRRSSCTYGEPNFGAIEIDWDASPQIMKVELRNVIGDPVAGVDIILSDLHSMTARNTSKIPGKYRHNCTLESDLSWLVRYRLAILLFLFLTVLLVALVAIVCVTGAVGINYIRKFKID